MRLLKRVLADIRGPEQSDQEAENIINQALMELQTNNKGGRNEVTIIDVKDINKDNAMIVYNILYDDPSLDNKGTT